MAFVTSWEIYQAEDGLFYILINDKQVGDYPKGYKTMAAAKARKTHYVNKFNRRGGY